MHEQTPQMSQSNFDLSRVSLSGSRSEREERALGFTFMKSVVRRGFVSRPHHQSHSQSIPFRVLWNTEKGEIEVQAKGTLLVAGSILTFPDRRQEVGQRAEPSLDLIFVTDVEFVDEST